MCITTRYQVIRSISTSYLLLVCDGKLWHKKWSKNTYVSIYKWLKVGYMWSLYSKAGPKRATLKLNP